MRIACLQTSPAHPQKMFFKFVKWGVDSKLTQKSDTSEKSHFVTFGVCFVWHLGCVLCRIYRWMLGARFCKSPRCFVWCRGALWKNAWICLETLKIRAATTGTPSSSSLESISRCVYIFMWYFGIYVHVFEGVCVCLYTCMYVWLYVFSYICKYSGYVWRPEGWGRRRVELLEAAIWMWVCLHSSPPLLQGSTHISRIHMYTHFCIRVKSL